MVWHLGPSPPGIQGTTQESGLDKVETVTHHISGCGPSPLLTSCTTETLLDFSLLICDMGPSCCHVHTMLHTRQAHGKAFSPTVARCSRGWMPPSQEPGSPRWGLPVLRPGWDRGSIACSLRGTQEAFLTRQAEWLLEVPPPSSHPPSLTPPHPALLPSSHLQSASAEKMTFSPESSARTRQAGELWGRRDPCSASVKTASASLWSLKPSPGGCPEPRLVKHPLLGPGGGRGGKTRQVGP